MTWSQHKDLNGYTDELELICQKILNSPEDLDKVINVALKPNLVLGRPVTFPESVPTGELSYVYSDEWYWTSGFFPGSVWEVYNLVKTHGAKISFTGDLLELARLWQSGIERQMFSNAHHDVGFVIMPSFFRDYQLTGSKRAAQVIHRAAVTLASRWNDKAKVIRSWDEAYTSSRKWYPGGDHCLVIIDSLMNLELLYIAASAFNDNRLANIATMHAETLLKSHFRDNHSTFHLVNFDKESGEILEQMTHQGYSDGSTWSRGQTWALYGYAVVYKYTKQAKFLDAAKRAADYFLANVQDGYVYWDFDAPRPCPYDSSAAMVACSGLLLIDELQGTNQYLPQVMEMYTRTTEEMKHPGECILDHATTNNNPDASLSSRKADHGLCYADYYLLETQNKLLARLGK